MDTFNSSASDAQLPPFLYQPPTTDEMKIIS